MTTTVGFAAPVQTHPGGAVVCDTAGYPLAPLPDCPPVLSPALIAQFTAEQDSEFAALEAAGLLAPPADLYDPDEPDAPVLLSEEDLYDDLPPTSRVDALDWELWAG